MDTLRHQLGTSTRTVPPSPRKEGETSFAKQKLDFTEEDEGGEKELSTTGESEESTGDSEESREKEVIFKDPQQKKEGIGQVAKIGDEEARLEEQVRLDEKARVKEQERLEVEA